MMTRDQRACASDTLHFAIRKLAAIQKLCSDGKTVNDIYLVVNFALSDIRLIAARRKLREKKSKLKTKGIL